jgi:hypothetical protein
MGQSVLLLPALRMCKKQAYEHDVFTHQQKDLGGNYARMRGANATLWRICVVCGELFTVIPLKKYV